MGVYGCFVRGEGKSEMGNKIGLLDMGMRGGSILLTIPCMDGMGGI